MSTVKIVLRTSKKRISGEAPLYLRITNNRKTSFISLKRYVLPKNWDENTQRVKSGHPNSVRLNQLLLKKQEEAYDKLNEVEINEGKVSADRIKHVISGKGDIGFIKFAEIHLARLYAQKRMGTYDKRKAVVSKIKQFQKNKDLSLPEVTVRWLQSFEDYLLIERKNAPNTIYSNLKVIKTIINNAIQQELLPYEKSPFRQYKLKWTKTKVEFLEEEEIRALEVLSMKKGSVLKMHRDMFLFAFNCGGLRISDMLKLKWKNFNGTYITVYTKKTTDPLRIKLTSTAQKILEEYRSENSGNDDYIFPCIKTGTDMDDPVIQFKTISSKTAQINTNLKKIADLAGIDKPLRTHIARHSFGTIALQREIPIEVVSKLMTHSNVKQTQVYAKIVNASLDKAMDQFDVRGT